MGSADSQKQSSEAVLPTTPTEALPSAPVAKSSNAQANWGALPPADDTSAKTGALKPSAESQKQSAESVLPTTQTEEPRQQKDPYRNTKNAIVLICIVLMVTVPPLMAWNY